MGSAHGPVIGSYGLRDIDGRVRVVNYVADEGGFRAAIATNEPGIVPKAPASVSIAKPTEEIVSTVPVTEVVAPAAAIAAPIVAQPQIVAAAAPLPQVQPTPYDLGIHSPLVASLASKIISARPLAYTGAKYGNPVIVQRPAVQIQPTLQQLPIEPVQQVPVTQYVQQPAALVGPRYVPASDALVRSYATSIYGPSLLPAPNTIPAALVASHPPPVAAAGPAFVKSVYQPPLDTPSVQYLQSQPAIQEAPVEALAPTSIAGNGYYEPSLAYAHPNAWGFTLGLPTTWGYQMVYRRKK